MPLHVCQSPQLRSQRSRSAVLPRHSKSKTPRNLNRRNQQKNWKTKVYLAFDNFLGGCASVSSISLSHWALKTNHGQCTNQEPCSRRSLIRSAAITSVECGSAFRRRRSVGWWLLCLIGVSHSRGQRQAVRSRGFSPCRDRLAAVWAPANHPVSRCCYRDMIRGMSGWTTRQF